jgi:hypothetical protein
VSVRGRDHCGQVTLALPFSPAVAIRLGTTWGVAGVGPTLRAR